MQFLDSEGSAVVAEIDWSICISLLTQFISRKRWEYIHFNNLRAIIPLENNFKNLIIILNQRSKNALPKKDSKATSANVEAGGIAPAGLDKGKTESTVSMSLLPWGPPVKMTLIISIVSTIAALPFSMTSTESRWTICPLFLGLRGKWQRIRWGRRSWRRLNGWLDCGRGIVWNW